MLFLSDSSGDFVGNLAYLRDAVRIEDPGADIRSVFKAGLRSRRRLRDALRLPFLLATSPVIVLDDFYPLIYPIRLRRGTRLIQVWHAAGAFKRVGHSRAGLPGGPTPGSDIHRNYTDVFVSSEGVRSDYAEAFGIDSQRVRALGVPRSDFFFDEARVSEAGARIRARYGIRDDERLAVFAPTFRGNGQLSAHSDESADWKAVAAQLGDGWRIAVRRHPFAARGARPLPAGVIDGSDGVEMNDLLAATDVLVTDYSSSIFEFALLRRPIVFYVPDFDEYAADRAFYRPFDDYAIGPVTRDPSAIADAIRRADVDGARFDRFQTEFCGALDGRSSARIGEVIVRASRVATARGAMVRRLRLDIAAAYTARFALMVVSGALLGVSRRRKITMMTREHSTPPLDFVLLREEILRADPTAEVVIIAKRVPAGILPKIGYAVHMVAQMYHAASSRVLIVDGYSLVASAARHGNGLTIVQLWHALGALKKFGLSILGRPEGRDPRLARAMRMHRNYDVVIASAEACRAPYAEAFGTDPAAVSIAPLPRVDRLRDPKARERAHQRLRRIHPDLDGRQLALYAPTFRAGGGSHHVEPLAMTRALADAGYATLTKLHPLVAPPRHPDLHTAPGMSTQDLLLVADVFVTDYSSAVFEAAVADVPSYLFAPDLDRYVESRDFYLDYEKDLGLPIARSLEQLTTQLTESAATLEQLAFVRRRFVEDVPVPGSTTPAADALAAMVLGWARPADEEGRQ